MRALRRPALLLSLLLAAAIGLLAGGSAAAPAPVHGNLVEVVVTLPKAPLAVAVRHDRLLAASVERPHEVDVRTPAAESYLGAEAAAQQRLTARLAIALPQARVRLHYSVALDGVSVVLPASELSRLRDIPGATVWPTVTYHSLRTTRATGSTVPKPWPGPTLIGAPSLWGPKLATAGQGIKIAILDDGVDQAHPYFNPTGYSYPPGFPKGNTAYTTPKVIVARAFPSPSTHWRYADTPFDPVYSNHATHVAGIAAGDYDTPAGGGARISGVAPKAYIGNYKVLTVPTEGFGLDGNSPEIAKAIDQAVADGMNVINLSIGEPEIEPRRDIVVQALDDAAAAGVVSAVAAGNDFSNAGFGSIGSPANAPAAITVAASDLGGDGTQKDAVAWFSSAGPTPVSLLPKPDVTAPGVDIVSSWPRHTYISLDGTSMATPHVAGAAALLLQRHPTWTPAEVKSALESTGAPVRPGRGSKEISTLREGGGRIDLVRADQPLLFTEPTSLGWGLVKRGFSGTLDLATTDAGGGSAPWTVSIAAQSLPSGATLTPQTTSLVAGDTLPVQLTVSTSAVQGDATGFVVLTRGSDVRRVPFWFHVEVPKLGLDPHRTLQRPGIYHGDTAGKASRVSTYEWPTRGVASGVAHLLGGPEQVFRFTLKRPVANFGVVVTSRAPGVRVSPRLVSGDDENRVVGYTGMPTSLNPYLGEGYDYAEPVVGAVLPAPGTYEFVFDTPTGKKPGRFTFRFWVNDTKPPTIKLLTRTVPADGTIRFAIHDGGSGVDPKLVAVRDHRGVVPSRYANGILSISASALRVGRHQLTVTASDYQETKNMEDVGPVLPNTRVLRAVVRISR